MQIADAENDSELQATLAIDEVQNIILETGFRKPFKNIALEDIEQITNLLVSYFCGTKVKAAMDQFVEGLESMDIIKRVRNDPSKWKKFFVASKTVVSASRFYNFR